MSITRSFEILSERDCRELLAGHDVGRVAFVDAGGFPVMVPVNYVIDGVT